MQYRTATAALSFVFALILTTFTAGTSCASLPTAAPEELSIQAAPALQFPFVPDPSMTQGSICTTNDPDFERLRYDEQIPYCARNVSRESKSDIYDTYGVPERCRKEYTIDHFIPLSIGGTNHRDNLWPEHKSIKALRKELENDLYKKVSLGEMTQAEAIKIIRDAKWNPPVKDQSKFRFCN